MRTTETTQRLAAIVDSSDDAIVSKDLNGIIRSWNRAAERIFGYSAAEAVGRSIHLIIPADRRSEEDLVISRITRGEVVSHFETWRCRKDGTLVPVSLTISPVRNGDGQIVGASKIARDISERREAERALVHAEAAQADLQRRLMALVSASRTLLISPRVEDVVPATLTLATQVVSADGYAVWRLNRGSDVWRIGAYQGISEEFARSSIPRIPPNALGDIEWPLAIEDVEASPPLAERRPAYKREGIRALLSIPLAIAGEFAGTISFYHRTAHAFTEVEKQTATALGNLASAAITTAELYDAQRRSRIQSEFLAEAGALLAASLDYHDTLRRVAELAVPHVADWCAVDLADEKGELERLAVAHVDPAKLEIARQFQARYPADPGSPYGAHHVVRTGNSVFIEQVTDEMLVAGARCPEHLEAMRALGVVSYMVVPLVARGRTLGAMTFASSDSGRHYSGSDLQFVRDVAYRAGLAVDNARAYEEARRANHLKDDFLATLSHELRTPLNAILGYARMLRNGVIEAGKQPRAIEIIERNASSLTRIVADVLDVSRIVSGKLQLRLEPVDLARIIADAIDTVTPAAEAKGLRLTSRIGPLGDVAGDAARLQQVVWNLLSNAVKFTPRGGFIQVSADACDDHIEIGVSDTGCGIAPEFLPFVFERFRQADSRFTREHGGLGLGLAITRHLVELHGGTVTAESTGLGEGATFRVRLPLVSVHISAQPPRVSREEVNRVPHRLTGVQVLVVDDQEDTLSLAKDVLEAAGARVCTASSGDEALEAIERFLPDVLIADLRLPHMDGLELLGRIRRRPALRDLPAAAVTASARAEDRIRALEFGFQLHLPKPIEPDELIGVVASLAGQKAG